MVSEHNCIFSLTGMKRNMWKTLRNGSNPPKGVQSEPLQSQHLKQAVRHRNEPQCLILVEQEKDFCIKYKNISRGNLLQLWTLCPIFKRRHAIYKVTYNKASSTTRTSRARRTRNTTGTRQTRSTSNTRKTLSTRGKKSIMSPLSFLLH